MLKELSQNHSSDIFHIQKTKFEKASAPESIDNTTTISYKRQKTDDGLYQTRQNYICYVDGCLKGFKYLYLFMYHLAGHGIFHFDCNFCKKRFPKFLLFKKHIISHHETLAHHYNIRIQNYQHKTDSDVEAKYRRKKLYAKVKIDNKRYANQRQTIHEKNKVGMEELLMDILATIESQAKSQSNELKIFDASTLLIKDHDFPDFHYLHSRVKNRSSS